MNHLPILYSLLLWIIICGILLFSLYLLISKNLAATVSKKGRRIAVRICAFFWIILITKLFFLDICHISGSSMEPTLKDGGYVLVSKLAYGPRIRNIWHKKSAPYERIFFFQSVKKGELIVFNLPIYQDRYVVKRVIGLPGEYIDISTGERLTSDKSQFFIPYRYFYIDSLSIDSLGVFERRAINYYHANSIKNNSVSNFTFNHSYYYVLGDNRGTPRILGDLELFKTII